MTTIRPHRSLILPAAVLLSLGLVLGGCGINAQSDAEAASSTEVRTADPVPTDALADFPAAADLTPPDEITGPSTAETVSGVEAVDSDETSQLPATVTDYGSKTVEVDDTSRILALDLYGTLADIVTGLGQGDSLVGRTTSNAGEQYADLPNVTENGHSLNAEAIMELRPTVVLMDSTLGPRAVIGQLRAAGIDVVEFTPDRHMADIDDHIEAVAAALGLPQTGEKLVAQVDAGLDHVEAIIDRMTPEKVDVSAAFLYVRGTANVFFVMGEDSGADELIDALGLGDAAKTANIEGIKPANNEALVALDPDLLLMMSDGLESTGGIDGLLERPGVAGTSAGANERVVDMADSQILSYGPNTPKVLLSLAYAIYAPDEIPTLEMPAAESDPAEGPAQHTATTSADD